MKKTKLRVPLITGTDNEFQAWETDTPGLVALNISTYYEKGDPLPWKLFHHEGYLVSAFRTRALANLAAVLIDVYADWTQTRQQLLDTLDPEYVEQVAYVCRNIRRADHEEQERKAHQAWVAKQEKKRARV